MRAVPFHLQGKGVLDLDVAAEISGLVAGKRKREEESCGSAEPTSVLERRRSPSPPTSTSTVSTSLGGSSGSIDTSGVAAVSDNPLHKWTPSQEGCSAPEAGRKEEWPSDLQPIPDALEAGGAGARCSAGGGGGLGMEDWDSVLSDSVALPGNEQSFFRWIMGDMDDPSLRQLLQSGGSSEFEGGGSGFGAVVDSGLGFGGASAPENVNVSSMNPPLAPAAASADSDYALNCNNSSNRLLVSSPNTTPLLNFRGSFFVSSNSNSSPGNAIFSPPGNSHLRLPISLPHDPLYEQQQMETIDEKPQLLNPQVLLNQQQVQPLQNPAVPISFPYPLQEQQQLPPQHRRQHPTIFDPTCHFPKTPFSPEIFLQQQLLPSFSNEHVAPHHLQQRQASKSKALMGSADNVNQQQQQQQQALVDQLLKAAELVETGNSVHARGILARLNHQLSHFGKPLERAAFYFKEALQLLLNTITAPHCNRPLPSSASPLDVVFKISAYKVFCEISPFLQFVNFTSNQALLEALDGFERIHILDFDIGIGGQWASFIQELALRRGGMSFLKISAFASMSTHHPLELELTKENLIHFASDLNISFVFNIINLDTIDLSTVLSLQSIVNLSDGEAVAVNFPVGYSNPPVTLLLHLVRQVSPKIVISINHGCEQSDLPFSQHFLCALQSFTGLFDSLDAVNVNSDAIHKIEKFLLQPRIERAVLGWHREGEKMLPWRTLFTSAGFSPLAFSNLTEIQADYMIRRPPVKGFDVKKCQTSLYLCWQDRELVSVSAWGC